MSSLISHCITIIIIHRVTKCVTFALFISGAEDLNPVPHTCTEVLYPLNHLSSLTGCFLKELLMDRASQHHRCLHGTLNTKRIWGRGKNSEGRDAE